MSDSAIWTRNGITDTRLVRNFAYLGGKWVAGEDGETIAVRNPADGAALGDVASLTPIRRGWRWTPRKMPSTIGR